MASKSFGSEIARRPSQQNKLSGTIGEVNDLRGDTESAFSKMETPGAGGTGLIAVDEWTNPAAADTNAIKTSIASVAAITTYSGADLNGVIGGGVMDPPRNPTITTGGATEADAPASAVYTGEDVEGNVISETLALSQAAGTAACDKCFAKVTSIALEAADGTGALLEFGFGTKIGLSSKAKTRAGGVAVIQEIMNGAAATAGVLAAAVASPPNGSYTPNTAANGAHDYAVYYERDLT